MPERPKRVCLHCGQTYVVHHKAAKYCSASCRVRAWKARERSVVVEQRNDIAELRASLEALGTRVSALEGARQ